MAIKAVNGPLPDSDSFRVDENVAYGYLEDRSISNFGKASRETTGIGLFRVGFTSGWFTTDRTTNSEEKIIKTSINNTRAVVLAFFMGLILSFELCILTLVMFLNLLAVLVVLLGLLTIAWIVWTYHKADKLNNISGVITMIAMVASLPLGVKLVMERTNFLSQASSYATVTAYETKKNPTGGTVVYVTLSDAAVVYLELEDGTGKKQVVVPEGRVEPRYAHSFILKGINDSKLTGRIFVNGIEDQKVLQIN